MRTKEMFISISDLKQSVKKWKALFIVLGCLAAFLSFIYATTRPLSFTAEGILKGQSPQKNISVYKALEFLGGESSDCLNEEPLILLKSAPILEELVYQLNLQATLTESDFGRRFKQSWLTLKTAHALRGLKKKQPPSQLASGGSYVTPHLIIPDNHPPLCCQNLCYLKETSTAFSIVFINEREYRVVFEGKEIGQGGVNLPFVWDGGTFTLAGIGKKGKVYALHLIPLPQAVERLGHTLEIKRDQESSNLVHIRYTHRNRHLASAIINGLMEHYQNYLKGECRKKITKQLTYLQQRQDESMILLESVLQKHKAFLEANLDTHSIILLSKELDFMAQKQGELKKSLLEMASEIDSLAKSLLITPSFSFAELLLKLQTISRDEPIQELSVESVRTLIAQRQQELDLCYLENTQYDLSLHHLGQENFDPTSLFKTIGDITLASCFEKIHKLHRKILDVTNWSEKERDQLKGELEKERIFLLQHIKHLKEGVALKEQALKERLTTLQRNLLFLLADRYAQFENGLILLSERASHFPEKWLAEQKLQLNTKLTTELMESVTKMIEVKNIGYNLEYLMTSPLKFAHPPLFPNPPHLFLKTLIGTAAALIALLFLLILHHLYKGPSASFHNLQALDKFSLIPEKETLFHLGLSLIQKGRVLIIASKKRSSFLQPLAAWLTQRGEKIHIYHLNCDGKKEAFITSIAFVDALERQLESYDRILIPYVGDPSQFELKALMQKGDAIAYGITDEKLDEIETLPNETILFIENQSCNQFKLKEIKPLLDKLLKYPKPLGSFYSAWVKNVWQRFLSKKI